MKKDYTHIEVVLDKSGSMARVAKDTIGTINTFLAEQRKTPGTASFRLTQFNHTSNHGEFYNSLNDVPDLTSDTYKASGDTSLLDAMGLTIYSLGERLASMPEAERPSKVIFVILTDGGENASFLYKKSDVFKMVSHQKEKYNWEFLFLAANQDAIKVATGYGVSAGAALNYATTTEGFGGTIGALNRVVSSTRGGGMTVNSTKSIYTAEEVKAAMGIPSKSLTGATGDAKLIEVEANNSQGTKP